MLLVLSIILINYCFHPLLAVELYIHRSVAEIRQHQKGDGIYRHLFKKNEYDNIIDGSISWDGTPFIKQEIYNTNDTLTHALVTVKQVTSCDCKTIQAKIIDTQTMLLENLETGTYFYADKHSIEYKYRKPSHNGVTVSFHFDDTNTMYNGTLSYLTKGITWVPNYDLSMKDFDTCHLQGYTVIRNNHPQEYQVNNTYLFSGDIQFIKNPSSTSNRRENSTAKSIETNDEEKKGFYYYSLQIPYTLRASSSVRLPFINITPQCQYYYKATVSIYKGLYKGIFNRYYELIFNKCLPAGIFTIRENQAIVGQCKLPDIPANYTQTISIGQDYDVRYSITSNLIPSNDVHTTGTSHIYENHIIISNLKNKEIKCQLEIHGITRITLRETTCTSGHVDEKMYILPIKLQQGEIYRCRFNVTLK